VTERAALAVLEQEVDKMLDRRLRARTVPMQRIG
jgi:hypothetical protein